MNVTILHRVETVKVTDLSEESAVSFTDDPEEEYEPSCEFQASNS
jgi:hypothetical protein